MRVRLCEQAGRMDMASPSVDLAPKFVDVAIIGGGLSGLALGVGLHNRGFHCVVLGALQHLTFQRTIPASKSYAL